MVINPKVLVQAAATAGLVVPTGTVVVGMAAGAGLA